MNNITPPLNIDTLREQAFRDSVSKSTQMMMERLTLNEQMRVSFVPLIITQLAWHFADKAMDCGARDKVSLLKKLSRSLKQVHQDYKDELRRELDYKHYSNIISQTDMCISELHKDLLILYFSVNGEFKRAVPDYPYDEMRCYAIMSVLFVDLLQAHNKEMDSLLAAKLRQADLAPSILPPLTQKLKSYMEAFAGVDGKFNFDAPNVRNAVKVIKIKIGAIEFSIF